MNAIQTHGLSKSYGDVHSLVDCTLAVPEGSVFGLLGPNGAGKSTWIRILMGFVRPDRGSAQVLSHDIIRESVAVRRDVAYLPGDTRLYRGMRADKVLSMFAELHPGGDVSESLRIADRLELDLRRRVGMMSTGMRQKLALAIVLGCRVPLLILDEPTANLDPDVRREVLTLITEANAMGRTIVLSSHIFSDVDATCSQVAILNRGRLLATQSLKDQPRLHIVSGRIPNAAMAQLTEMAGEPFVRSISFAANPSATGNCSDFRLQVVGETAIWMPWLTAAQEALEMVDLRLNCAGIESFYDASLLDQSPHSVPTDEAIV